MTRQRGPGVPPPPTHAGRPAAKPCNPQPPIGTDFCFLNSEKSPASYPKLEKRGGLAQVFGATPTKTNTKTAPLLHSTHTVSVGLRRGLLSGQPTPTPTEVGSRVPPSRLSNGDSDHRAYRMRILHPPPNRSSVSPAGCDEITSRLLVYHPLLGGSKSCFRPPAGPAGSSRELSLHPCPAPRRNKVITKSGLSAPFPPTRDISGAQWGAGLPLLVGVHA